MIQVWEFPLHAGEQSIDLPIGADVLSAGSRAAGFVLWTQVDIGADKAARKFSVVRTDWDVQGTTRTFISSFLDSAGDAWHVFEILS